MQEARAVNYVFQCWDESRTGLISKSDLLDVLKLLDPSWSDSAVHALVDTFSRGDKLIQYEDFVGWLFPENASSMSCDADLDFCGTDIITPWRKLVQQGRIQATVTYETRPVCCGLTLDHVSSKIIEFAKDVETSVSLLSDGLSGEKVDGPKGYFATLSAVRKFKPAPTPKLADFPPYDPDIDSFVTGSLRLQIREKLAVVAPVGRAWDVHFNISPMVVEGHALLVPSLDDYSNWRSQVLLKNDCVDLVAIAADSCAWAINFNSPRAGASQNHIHAHAWLKFDESIYAVELASKKASEQNYSWRGVSIRVLEYDTFAVLLSGAEIRHLGSALFRVVDAAQRCSWPHNVLIVRDRVWVFLRRSDGELVDKFGAYKLGGNQIAGWFTLETEHQLQLVRANPEVMTHAVAAASADWNEARALIRSLFQSATETGQSPAYMSRF